MSCDADWLALFMVGFGSGALVACIMLAVLEKLKEPPL